MGQIHVYVSLSTEDALANDETRSGDIRIPVTQELLAPLSAEERVALAKSCNADARDAINFSARLKVRALSAQAIAAAVRERMAQDAAEAAVKAEKARQVETLLAGLREGRLAHDPDQIPGKRWSVLSTVAKLVGYPSAELDLLRAEADTLDRLDENAHDARLLDEPVERHIKLRDDGTWDVCAGVDETYWSNQCGKKRYPRAFARAKAHADARNAERAAALKAEFDEELRKALTPEQWERYEAGVLPLDEREGALREYLFRGVDLPLYQRLEKTDVVHADDCDEPRPHFDVDDHDDLDDLAMTSEEFAATKRVRAAFAENPRLESIVWREHNGDCRSCDCPVRRYGARVTLRVNGHTYSREYAIG